MDGANYGDILYDRHDDGVLVITFNRPEQMNALGGTMVPDLLDACRRAKEDDEVRAVVITGAGRGFCAGADLSRGTPRGEMNGRAARLDRHGSALPLNLALRDIDKPLIGAINGPAAGAGFGIACSMDIRIVSSAARFATIFIKRGLGPDFASSYYLPRIVGPAMAYELFYTGRFVSAEEAKQIGLANRVVEPERLMDETLALAREIAAGPPQAMTFTRRALKRSLDNSLEDQLEFEWTNQLVSLASEDAQEGVLAWKEQRSPRFVGR